MSLSIRSAGNPSTLTNTNLLACPFRRPEMNIAASKILAGITAAFLFSPGPEARDPSLWLQLHPAPVAETSVGVLAMQRAAAGPASPATIRLPFHDDDIAPECRS